MNRHSHTLSKADLGVSESTPKCVVDVICNQIKRNENAKNSIDIEGAVVRDMRGNVVPHPAISIESSSAKTISDLITKHKRKENETIEIEPWGEV